MISDVKVINIVLIVNKKIVLKAYSTPINSPVNPFVKFESNLQ